MAPHVVFELAWPRRRIDRHRDRPGHLHREEGGEVVEAGRQHQRRGLARREPPVGEAGGEVLGALHQRGERDPHGLSVRCIGRSVQLDVDAVAVAARVEIDRFEQRRGGGGDRVRRLWSSHRFRSRHGQAGRFGTVGHLRAGMGRFAAADRLDTVVRPDVANCPSAVNGLRAVGRSVRPGRPRRPPAALAGP